jgi:DNA-binding HxlR family transcriptional regulator
MRRQQANLGATKLTILRECALSESTWSKLLKSTGVSEKVLAGHLRDLRERGLLVRRATGYLATDKGKEVTRELQIRLSAEKWKLLEEWRKRGIARTYAELVTLALEQLHDKIVERDLHEARLKRLEKQSRG